MTPRYTPEKPPDHKKEDDEELTHEDIVWIREQRQLDEHAKWLRGQIRVIWPWVVSIIGAVVTAAIWIRDHVRF